MDMIVRLSGQDAGYVSTMNRASQSTWRVHSSLDTLTGSMERQLGIAATTTRQTEILALADRGAAAAKVEYALSLANQLEQMEMLNAAEAAQASRDAADRAAAEQAAAAANRQADAELRLLQAMEQRNIELAQGVMAAKQYEILNSTMSAEAKELALALLQQADALAKKNAAETAATNNQATIDKVTSGLKRQAFEAAHGADALALYELKAKGASQAELALAARLLQSIAATKQANAAKAAANAENTAAEAANRAFVEKSIVSAQQQNTLRGVSKTYLTLQEMAQRGATEAEIEAYYSAVQLTQKLDQQSAAYQRKTAAVQRASAATGGHTGASTRNLMAMQSLAFGIQDAAQVYGNTGLAGALSASANNLIFMTQMLNPQLALVTALAVAGGQFAAVLLPMAFNSKSAAKEAEAYNERLKEQIEYTKQLAAAQREFLHTLEDVADRQSGQSLQKRTQREGQDLDAEIKGQIQLIDELERKHAEQREREMNFRANHQSLGGQMAEGVGLTAVGGVAEQKAIEKELAARRKELQELEAKRRENMRQQPLADTAARNSDIKQHEEEARVFAKEERERRRKEDTELVEARWKAEQAAHERFVKDKQALEERTAQETMDQEQAGRVKILQELAERQQQIGTWLNEGRIDVGEAQRLRLNASQAAGRGLSELDQKAAEAAKGEQLAVLEAREREQKAKLDGFGDGGKAKDLTAVEAGSAQGLRAIFEAIGGANDPQREIAKNTAAALRVQIDQYNETKRLIDELKKSKPLKTSRSK